LLHPWFVRFEYQRSGFPADEFGLSTSERTRLALVGLRSVVPWRADGIGLLERARLSDGEPAFNARELDHMREVRVRILALLALDAVALPALLALLATGRTRRPALDGLRAGAVGTLGLGAAVGAALAVNPIAFLTG